MPTPTCSTIAIHESAAWVLLESAIADLPTDLRWLLGRPSRSHNWPDSRALGVTSAAVWPPPYRIHAARSGPERIDRTRLRQRLNLSGRPRIALGARSRWQPILETSFDARVIWASRHRSAAEKIRSATSDRRRRRSGRRHRRAAAAARLAIFTEATAGCASARAVQVGVRLPDPANAGARSCKPRDRTPPRGARAHAARPTGA